jgi:hypothetical protein
MHKLQENVSLLVSLTSAPGALFNIFHKKKVIFVLKITLTQLFKCELHIFLI